MPSENVDRRTRKREARRDHLLDLAADLVDEVGVDGVTMAALAEAADYAPASLYTYFASRSALLAALQERALLVLAQVGRDAAAAWDEALDGTADPRTAALARLCGFADLFLAAPRLHQREFRLQQELLVTPGVEEAVDAGPLVPVAMSVLALPEGLLDDAVEVGALAPTTDAALTRTLAWVVAMNGALLVDGLVTGLAISGAELGTRLTDSLLLGWGADAQRLAMARTTSGPWLDRTSEVAS